MTEQEKYNLLLQELAGVIQSKNTEIAVLKYRISELEDSLKDAEASGKNDAE